MTSSSECNAASNARCHAPAAALCSLLAVATAQYNEGVADFLDVIDSQRSLYSAQEQLVQSTTDTTLQVMVVFKAL